MPKVQFGDNYKRFDKEGRCWEYIAYGGQRGSMWHDDRRYYHRDQDSKLVPGKPALYLKQVWWMNPNAIIENVKMPEFDNKHFEAVSAEDMQHFEQLCFCMYHGYSQGFNMRCEFRVKIADMNALAEHYRLAKENEDKEEEQKTANPSPWQELCKKRWPIEGVAVLKNHGSVRQEMMRCAVPAEFCGKTVAFYVEVWDHGSTCHSNWFIEGASVMVKP